MSTNCLVTKLKSEVSNNYLAKVGEMLFIGIADTPFDIRIDNKVWENSVTVRKVVCNSSIIKDLNGVAQSFDDTITIGQGCNVEIHKGDIIGVTSKYDFKELLEQGILKGNVEDYGYLNADISSISVGRSGDLSVLRKYTNLKKIGLFNPDVSNFIEGTEGSRNSIERIEIRFNDHIVCSMADLASFSALTQCMANVNSVSGTIEDYVAAANTLGRTSGSIIFNFSAISFNGTVEYHEKQVFEWSGTTITRTEVIN